jgi:hypothetical protein
MVVVDGASGGQIGDVAIFIVLFRRVLVLVLVVG